MTAQYFYESLGRLIEAGTIDKDAEVFTTNQAGYSAPVIAINPVNFDVSKVATIPSVALTFGRLT